ncbi:MAG: 7TM diverse intracellular signaling domain-containing protein [Spirosomataceae bacterium]
MKKSKGTIAVIIVGLFTVFFAGAQTSFIALNEKSVTVELWGKTDYLEDTSKKLTIHHLLKNPRLPFKKSAQHAPDFGFTEANYWIRFRIQKQTNQSINWVVQNDYPMIDELDLYLIDEESKKIFHLSAKDAMPYYQRGINVHQCAFPLDIHPYKTYTVYLRLIATDAKKMQLKIKETHQFYKTYFDELWFWSAHLGFVICMIIVQTVFLLVTKERNFLLYILFITGYLSVAVVGGYGIVDNLLWPSNEWMERYSIVIAVTLSNVLGVLFYAHALRLKKLSPFLYKVLQLDGILSIVFSSWIYVWPDVPSPNVYSCALIIVFFCLVSIACVVSYRQGNQSAIYYLFGTIAYFLGVMIVLMWTLGYLSPSIFVVNAMHIGSMFEMVFFTWALAHDYRRSREEREETQKELILTLQSQNKNISEALVRGQKLERKRVAADLHDSLGGTLSAIRWTLASFNPDKLTSKEQQVYESLVEMTNEAHQRVRFLSHNLLPEDLEKDGLSISLEKLTEKLNRSDKTVFSSQITLYERLEKQTEFELYSICLELINNIIKHAGATEAQIKLYHRDAHIYLEIFDNGQGIREYSEEGKGLKNIQERVASLKGTWQIESTSKGTYASAQVPIS